MGKCEDHCMCINCLTGNATARRRQRRQPRWTFCAASQLERHEGADDSEYVVRQQRVHFASVRVRAEKFENAATRDSHLLLLRAREVSVDGVRHAGRALQAQIVQEHGGGSVTLTTAAQWHRHYKQTRHHWLET